MVDDGELCARFARGCGQNFGRANALPTLCQTFADFHQLAHFHDVHALYVCTSKASKLSTFKEIKSVPACLTTRRLGSLRRSTSGVIAPSSAIWSRSLGLTARLRSAPAAAELCVTAYSSVYDTNALKETVRDWGEGTCRLCSCLPTHALKEAGEGPWSRRAPVYLAPVYLGEGPWSRRAPVYLACSCIGSKRLGRGDLQPAPVYPRPAPAADWRVAGARPPAPASPVGIP